MIRITNILLVLVLAYNVTMSPIGSDNKSSSLSHSSSDSSQNNEELARLLKLYIQTKKNLMENVLRDEQNYNDYKVNEDADDEEEEASSNDDADDYETDTYLNKRSAPRRIFIGKRNSRMPVNYHPEDDAESYMDKRAQIHRVFIGKRKLAHDIKRIFIG
jgi:hypothetical protein